MIFVCILLFGFWKIFKKTKFVRPEEADLVWEKPAIDAYEASIDPPLGLWEDIWVSTLEVLRIRKKRSVHHV